MKIPNSSELAAAPFADVKSNVELYGVKYPRIDRKCIADNVYVNSAIFDIWDAISRYLPVNTYIASALIPPEVNALNGLQILRLKKPSFDINSLKVSSNTSTPPSINLDFFNTTQNTASSVTQTTDVKSNPELNGKFEDIFLFEVNYVLLKNELTKLGITWNTPYSDDAQLGKVITIATPVQSELDQSKLIVDWFISANPDLNITSEVLNEQLIIKLNSTSEYKFIYEFGVVLPSNNSGLSALFTPKLKSKIYRILKANDYGDLEDTLSPSAAARYPKNVRRKGSLLADALMQILSEVLNGSEGVISGYQGSIDEYLAALINGLIAAQRVVSVELDRLGGGDVTERSLKAFESAAIKSTCRESVRNLVKSGGEINTETIKMLVKLQPELESADASTIKSDLSNSRLNQSKS